MQSKGESMCTEVGQWKFCGIIIWREELKEVKSASTARYTGYLKLPEAASRTGVDRRHEYSCSRNTQDPAQLLLPHLQTDGWGGLHPTSWGLNPDLITVGSMQNLPSIYNTVGLGDPHGSKWVTVSEQAVWTPFFIIISIIAIKKIHLLHMLLFKYT